MPSSRSRVENWTDGLDRMAVDEAVLDLIERQTRAGAPSRKLNGLSCIRQAMKSGREWITAKQRSEAIAAMKIMVAACDRGRDTGCGVLSNGGRNHCFACTRSRKILETR